MAKLAKNLMLIYLAMVLSLSPLMANAMPDMPAEADNAAMMAEMDMNACHHQQDNKKCGHCDDTHKCNASHSGCFTSTAIATQTYQLSVVRSLYLAPLTVADKHPLQVISLLFRPPISA
ncbi:hypothetical protein [Methylophaga sp. OBS4]|uniref:hypothetical protein n=1 Tax=Methylophaga sp. OBS4 TaxID=2991935 RepID=UPI002253C48C|nr:hypothetical protein [Methylophaga sp. OBS4]MCX4186280.1 hypothetical protein [Methylophaga sp. OBS4]